MQSDNPEDLNLLFYDFNRKNKDKKSVGMKRANQIDEETEENEEDWDYEVEHQFSGFHQMNNSDHSFDKRNNIENCEKAPFPVDALARGPKQSDTHISVNYLLNANKDIGQRTMINWATKKDRLPSRGIHTRGGGRRRENR